MERAKKIHIITHGCQMNLYDSVRMKELLAGSYVDAEGPEDADLIIINTCSVREKPQQKVLAELGNLKPLKRRKPGLVLAVAGCVAQQEKDQLLEKALHLDLVIGPDKIADLPELLEQVKRKRMVATGFDKGAFELDEHPALESFGKVGSISAFIAVQKGCDHFCSYCIVPHVRGREKSRDLASIVKEIEKYARVGVKEITLLGQNINGYGNDRGKADFADLLQAAADVPGIRRIRFVTSHPVEMTQRHINAMARIEKVCKYLHLPVQSGSSRVLKAMNRGYTAKQYLKLIEKIRKSMPDIALSGDMIVGFPGETEEDFQATLDLMEAVRYDVQFSFIYSPRPHTKAADMDDPIVLEEKKKRLQRLQSLQKKHTLDANKRLLNTVQEVLVDGTSKKSEQDLMGRTECNKIVNFTAGPELIGKFVKLRISDAFQNSLRGKLLK